MSHLEGRHALHAWGGLEGLFIGGRENIADKQRAGARVRHRATPSGGCHVVAERGVRRIALQNRTSDSVAAAGSLTDPVEESSPHRTKTSPRHDIAAEADSVQFRFPALSSARMLVNSGKEDKSTVATVAATSREKSAAATPPTALSTTFSSTADDVVKWERPSRPTVAGITAVASANVHSSVAIAPRGRPTNEHPQTQPQ